MKLFKFLVESIKLRITEQMMYKLNFLLMIITLLSFDLVLPLITILIYMKTNGFPGWSFEQILLFQGVFIFINSIDRMFFQRVDWSLSYDVRSGVFDRYLLYPINTLGYITFTNFGLEHLADFTLGIGLIIYSVIKLQLALSIGQIFLFLGFILIGLIFIFSLAILKFSIIIRTVKIGRLGEFFRAIKNYGQYPVTIYNSFMSSLFRYILPLTVLAFIPSKILIEGMSSNFIIAAVAAIAIFLLSISLWDSTLKKYTSAGG